MSATTSEAVDGDDAPVRAPGPQTGGHRFGTVGMPAETSRDFAASSRRLLHHVGAERWKTVLVVVLAVASVVMVVVGPRILGHATDIVFDGINRRDGRDGIDVGELHRVLLLALGLYLVAFVLAYLQGFVLAGLVQRSMYRMRGQVEEKLHRLPLSYVDAQARGDLLSRVTNDIDNIAQSLQQTLSQLLTSALTMVGVLVMMVLISPMLTLVALVTVPASILTMRAIAERSKRRFVAQWRHTGALNAQVEETFTGHAIVKAFGHQRAAEEQFRRTNEELFEAGYGAQYAAGSIQPAMSFLGNLNYVAIAVIGGLRVASGSLGLGDVQASIQYSRQFTQPLTHLASMVNVLQSGIASAERVFELLDAPEQVPDVDHAERPTTTRGHVEFDHVSFSYRGGTPLITDLSLVAHPGQTVAIVGPTGAGKTTLVNLLMRFYEIDAGVIRLDGRDIASMPRRELRAKIGMVLQDTWLFGGTIRENIAYGNPDATEEQLQAAATATYVDRFVRSLPEGYDTIVDDEGTSVSAGEKQLLTIARAFLADPAILILDEATSSVDTRTEVLIQHAMAALRRERTSFVIAHRLSTIRDADVILVMEQGRIVEQGDHTSLLAAGGAYHRLHRSQFSAPVEELR